MNGEFQIIEGDCLAEMPKFADLSFDHIFADPPYSEHVHGKSRAGARIMPDADKWKCNRSRAAHFGFESIKPEEMKAAALEFGRISRRWVLVFSDLESTGNWRDALTGYENSPLEYIRTGVWVKLNATPQFTGDRPSVGCEGITIAHPKGRKRWNGGGTHGVWTHAVARNGDGGDLRLHTTQKPIKLMRELIRLFTDEGDTILDPYCGSGTTGLACILEGRNFVGIERDPHYVSVARARLSRASGVYAEMPKRRNVAQATTPLFDSLTPLSSSQEAHR